MSEALREEKLEEMQEDVSASFVGPRIMSDAEAETAIREYREKQAEIDYWDDYYKAQMQKIKAQCQYVMDNQKARLRDYFDRVPHRSSATRESYDLPSGKLVWKNVQPKYDRQDADVIKYLKESDIKAFIKVKEELDWANLKKELRFSDGEAFLKETGEKVPGIKVIEQGRDFTIEK